MEIETVNKAIDLFIREDFPPTEIPQYLLDWIISSEDIINNYICLVSVKNEIPKLVSTTDSVIVPIELELKDAETEAEKFIEYLITNSDQLGIQSVPNEKIAEFCLRKDKSVPTLGNKMLKYKNLLVKEDYMVMPTKDDEMGLCLLQVSAVKIIK